jgi:hypothetical protein
MPADKKEGGSVETREGSGGKKKRPEAAKVRVKKPGVTRTIAAAELDKFLRLGWERM